MNTFLSTNIKTIKGVGTVRAEVLNKELGIFTVADLLSYYPFRYVDRSKYYAISEIDSNSSYIQLKGYLLFQMRQFYRMVHLIFLKSQQQFHQKAN